MWQYRIRCSPDHLAAFAHGDDVKVKCACSILLGSDATGSRLDGLQSNQQLGRFWFQPTRRNRKMRDSVDIERLFGWRKRFSSVPS